MMRRAATPALMILLAMAAACTPVVMVPGPAVMAPVFQGEHIRTADGAALPLRAWLPEDGKAKAVIVALHGFNDYGDFFAAPGRFLAARGIASYAFDQRGFGRAPNPGLWPGTGALVADVRTVTALVRGRHPGIPLYLLGASMGGAVLMVAMTAEAPPEVDGVILSAPAVWGRATMPFYQRWALWLAAHTVPWLKLTGRGLKIRASDNIEMLRALGRDPLIIRETRIDAMHGLTDLMDAALAAAPRFAPRALILYGANDEVIRRGPTEVMLHRLPEGGAARRRLAYYGDGFHMLLRDLQGETVWIDIAAWIADKGAPLPSGADRKARQRIGNTR